ncbi:MAG TPA: sulfatase, partial [Verrucomicrobiales bacterium]|nr:sulfatase [Verrucomicrobiales bacterium]
MNSVRLLLSLFVFTISSSKLTADLSAETLAKDKRRPNIIFFLVDDLGQRDVGCYGSQFHETPAIDQLAKEGMRFTDAYATCHVCSPSRASILTGKYPARTNLTEWLGGRP